MSEQLLKFWHVEKIRNAISRINGLGEEAKSWCRFAHHEDASDAAFKAACGVLELIASDIKDRADDIEAVAEDLRTGAYKEVEDEQ